MKSPVLASLVALMLAAAGAGAAEAGAAEAPARFGETTVAAEQGSRMVARIPFETAAGWRYLAFSVGAYRPYVPTACLKAAPWPLVRSEHGPEWDSFGICPWTWLARGAAVPSPLAIALDTTGWPPGDYRLYASLLFRDEALPEAQRDRYVHRPILLSVLPAPAASGSAP